MRRSITDRAAFPPEPPHDLWTRNHPVKASPAGLLGTGLTSSIFGIRAARLRVSMGYRMLRSLVAALTAAALAPLPDTPALSATAELGRAATRDSDANSPPGYYRIRNYGNNKYLAIGASSTENGAHAIQWEYIGSQGQLWHLDADGKIINANSRKCLATGNGSTENGAHAIQWDCLDSDSQRWVIGESGFIRNVGTGKYLAIGASSTANGPHAIQWDYTGSGGQRSV
ncbi:RICIN domain-containing protein [Nonomuraea fuscirosea]|uniref:RICIN domain-containing protein n=1 Tax=Nonomuraea fuscirosea TaxID=1291556 RepID=UPI0033D53075